MEEMNIDIPSSSKNMWDDIPKSNRSSLDLFVPENPNALIGGYNENNDDNEDDDDDDDDENLDEIEIDERQKRELDMVSSIVAAAYERVGKYNQITSANTSNDVSEESSVVSASTYLHTSSLPENLDASRAELRELKTLPPSLETALRVNLALQKRLSVTLSNLELALQRNLKRQKRLLEEEETQGVISGEEKYMVDNREKHYVRPSFFSIPYFKDRYGASAQLNTDAKKKVSQGYMDLYHTKKRVWMTEETNCLITHVQDVQRQHFIDEWKNSLQSVTKKLSNFGQNDDSSEKLILEEEKEWCEKHIDFFKNLESSQIDIPKNSVVDWDRISALAFDGLRSPEECQLMWENLLHPSINKGPWREEEDIAIQRAMLSLKDDKLADWGLIAESLNSQRTAYQVMSRWMSFIRPATKPSKFTPESSKRLQDLVCMLKVGSHIPWPLILQHLTGYTKAQLQARWRYVNPDQARGPFSQAEDFVMLKGLFKFGTNFELIAHFMSGRNAVQVKNRFKRAVLPGLATNPWTWDEDRCIIKNCNVSNSPWRTIGKLLPKRDVCQIRMRFIVFNFWQKMTEANELPPPLFPLSMTTDPLKIKVLRRKLQQMDRDVKLFLNLAASKTSGIESDLFRDLNQKAINLKEQEALMTRFVDAPLTGGPAPVRDVYYNPFDSSEMLEMSVSAKHERRNRQEYAEKCLVDFFVPGRIGQGTKILPNDSFSHKMFLDICEMLSFNIKAGDVAKANLDALQRRLDWGETDMHLLSNSNIFQRKLTQSSQCDLNSRPVVLIPPNKVTMGAFKSLLIHEEKLKEMALSDFVIYQIPTSSNSDQCNDSDIVNPSSENLNHRAGRDSAKRANKKVAELNSFWSGNKTEKDSVKSDTSKGFWPAQNISEEEQRLIKIQGEIAEFPKKVFNDGMLREVIEKEDNLLFQRVMSLFFWPAVLSQHKPSNNMSTFAGELCKHVKLDLAQEVSQPVQLPVKSTSKYDYNINAQEDMVNVMESVMIYKRHTFQTPLPELKAKITMEDMKQKVSKKKVVRLKRSLIMKKAWRKDKGDWSTKKITKSIKPPSPTRPRSKRIAERMVARLRSAKAEESAFVDSSYISDDENRS